MFKQITTDDGVSVTIETRAGGRVRLGLSHPVIDMQRVTMEPLKALEIAQALLNAGHAAAMVQLTNTGEGGQVGRSQRAQAGRVRWDVLAVIAGNVVAWGAFLAVCAVSSGWRP